MPPNAEPQQHFAGTHSAPVDFTKRADLCELMDEPCDFAVLRSCLQSLETCNRLFRAYQPTLAFLDRVAARASGATIHIVDVGSGYGDMLRRVRRWSIGRRIPVALTGIDLNPHARRAASEADRAAGVPVGEICWITGDAMHSLSRPADVVLSSLLTHHLTSERVVDFLRWMEEHARYGWLINDLERQPVPYYLFGLFSRLARMHPFVQHDGPVSFRRAFRQGDWQRMLSEAALPQGAARIFRSFPARLCVERLR